MTHRRPISMALLLVCGLAALATPVAAQNPSGFDGCIAEALTQSAAVAADGRFRLANVPSTTGLLFRVLVTCPAAEVESRRRLVTPFTRIVAGQTLAFAATDFSAEVVPPSKLTLRAPRRLLGFTGDRVFTVLEGQFPDGSRRNLTYPQTGTTFRSSNPAVATIDPTGCVIAQQPGASTIAAFNSGRTASLRVTVAGGTDSDGDGMSDACEQANGLDPRDPTDADDDPDTDDLDNRTECLNGTDPFAADTDADGLDDPDELAAETDPINPDTDDDGLSDGDEVARGTDPLNADTDTDCLADGLEIQLGLNPLVADGPPDVDGDGLTNCDELTLGTDPGSPDTDGDAINDGEEVVAGADGFVTDPRAADTDGDGLNDEAEIAFGSNPTDPTDLRTQVVIDGRDAVLSGRVRLNSLTLRNGAVLRHSPTTGTREQRLELEVAGTLTIDATSRIDVSARGFLGGRTTGNPVDAGRTLGNVAGSERRSGGSYGGLGVIGDFGAANPVYGDFRNPNEPGSGGASQSGSGGNGGGLARITAAAVVLEGEIAADGGEGLGDIAAGGSGGALRLDVGTLSGGGSIHANGGLGDDQLDQAGGGGGGRVALYYDQLNGFALTRIAALGGLGNGQRTGGPGTVYVKRRADLRGQLIVRGAGIETPLPEAITIDDVLLDAATVAVENLQPNALALVNGALLTHPGANGTQAPQLAITAATVSIDAMSRIDVSTRGFLGGRTAGNPADPGRTLGNVAGSERRGGGSYGGLGNLGDAGAPINPVYGDFRNPNEPGSGGASESGSGGNGGGVVRLQATALTLDGQIVADGGEGLGDIAAGGSGGAIRLDVGTLSGGGSVHANGGMGDDQLDQAGGGGGGRIAIHYTTIDGFDVANVQALGGQGRGPSYAGVGTVYFRVGAQGGGELILDNADRATDRATPLYSLQVAESSALSANTLSDTAAGFVPGTLMGLELNPNTEQGKTFTVVANDATTLFTDPADGDLREVTAAGQRYGAGPVLDAVVIARRAVVEVLDGNSNRNDRRGFLEAGALTMRENALLQHPVATTTSTFGLDLRIRHQLSIDETSRIDASARGFLGGRSGDNGGDAGLTMGNVAGSTRRNGGSYGGLGGFGNGEGSAVAPVYGDFRNPNEPGSGGASESGGGGNGGGLIRISADILALGGEIAADGSDGLGDIAAGGSGGAIRIDVHSLEGDHPGSIHANGGSGDDQLDQAGGGGGGRIAIYYTVATNFDLSAVDVAPGPGPGGNAGPGSVFLRKRSEPEGELRVRGTGRETPLATGVAGDRLVLDAARVSAVEVPVAALTLLNGAVLTHDGATGAMTSNLAVTVAGTLTIDATSRIDVSARGFLGGRTAGNPVDAGRTLGNVAGSERRSGGSYGGLGVIGDFGAANPVYGDFRNPNEPGSGGASQSGSGGNGGGLARITAAAVVLEGEITADGGEGLGDIAAGGSGGAIRLDVGTLSGGGRIDANGGLGDDQLDQAGGGGGGRVALYYDQLNGFALTRIAALGGLGNGARTGGPGTVYVKRRADLRGQLIVRGAGIETPLPEAITTDDVLLDAATVAVENLQPNALMLVNGALLTHPGANGTQAPQLAITAATVSIDAMSRIDVSTRGFLGGRTAGNPADAGRTLGNVVGSERRGGGSYGGLGNLGDAGAPINPVYGDFRNPNEPGSGGASESGSGGNGGGVVRLQATALTLDGQILADGGEGLGDIAAGGSGGAIRLDVGTLSGGGSMHANGGTGDDQLDQAGGGGGGRIAIHYTTIAGFDVTKVQALGGQGRASSHGGVGTVFFKLAAQSGGELIFDNADRATDRATPLYSLQGAASTGLAANSLADAAANFVPGTLVGLELNPDTTQTQTFTVVANDATTLFTDPADGDLTTVASGGAAYGAEPVLDRIEIMRRAVVEVLDGDGNRSDRRGLLSATELVLSELAVLQHPAATTTSTFGLELNIDGPLSIDSTSRIDANARGFLGGRSGGNGGDPGLTIGNVAGSTRHNGGSYGGLGGFGNEPSSVVNPVYGTAPNPNEPGSGGASESGSGGSGGGLIRIAAGTIIIEGQITADGGDGQGDVAAGGSGGAIRLDVAILAGAGSVHANGGPGDDQLDQAGGGGGGRIAIFAEQSTGFPLANVQANGGPGFMPGQPGTVHVAP